MLALATVGMLLIALVSIGGFTVLAQRRLRALGMLESMGATDRNVRLVLEANGVIVGAVGAVLGLALGFAAWVAYRPHDEQSAHHLIPMLALPWNVIVPAMVLAVIATFFAASYPARAITRVPVVAALAGRPAPPRRIHRSFVPGVIALVVGFVFFSLGRRAPWERHHLVDSRVHRAGGGDHPRGAVLPGPAGPGGRTSLRSPSACRCATWRATGPGPARPFRPSASA